MRRKLLLLPVVAAGMVGLSHGQPPGGGGDGGGRRMTMMGGQGGAPDPEMIWGFVSKGQPTINLNDPANARTKQRMIDQGQAIPADGVLTKEAFKANWQASMDKRAAGGGQPGAAPAQFQPGGPGGGTGGGGGRGGGFDPSQMTDDQLSGFMRRYDTDGDGRISKAEALASGSDQMKEQFDQYDANRDGYWDVTEYRVYNVSRFQQRMQQRDQGQPQPFQPQPGQPSPFQPQPMPGQPMPGQPAPSDEPARPDVWRYGKLPKGAPSWFLAPTRSNPAGLDADHDGQIGLYEWRRAGRPTAEFVEKDLNGDGYLTYLEYETWVKRLADKQKEEDPDAPAPTTVITPAGGDRGTKGGDRKGGPPGGGKGERKAGSNPFANGSKGG